MNPNGIGNIPAQPMDWTPTGPAQQHQTPQPALPQQPAQQGNGPLGALGGRDGTRPNSLPPRTQLRIATTVNPMLERLDSQPNMQGVQLMAGTAMGLLTQAGVQPRLGGSIAARVNGAPRQPQDIDLEVRSPNTLKHAFDTLANANADVVREDGAQFHVTGQPLNLHDGVGGVVQLNFTHQQSGELRSVSVDLTNENNALFNKHLISPAERGVHPTEPSFVTPPELVMNYLDRLMHKNDVGVAKGDPAQIASILREAKFDPNNQSDMQHMRQQIGALVRPDSKPAFEQAFDELAHAMRSGQI